MRVRDPGDPEAVARAARALAAARGDRLAASERDRLARQALFQAAAEVREGDADCMVAGAVHTSAEVLRASIWLLGLAPGVSTVSSFFVMILPAAFERAERVFAFADCGVYPGRRLTSSDTIHSVGFSYHTTWISLPGSKRRESSTRLSHRNSG